MRRWWFKSDVKALGSTWEWHWKLDHWSAVEDGGIPGVAVKCVEIGRKAGGEGGALERF